MTGSVSESQDKCDECKKDLHTATSLQLPTDQSGDNVVAEVFPPQKDIDKYQENRCSAAVVTTMSLRTDFGGAHGPRKVPNSHGHRQLQWSGLKRMQQEECRDVS